METLRAIFTEFIPALWLAISHEGPDAVNYLERQIGPRAMRLWHTFLWLVIIAVGVPICLIGLAVLTKAGWLIALIGILLACFLAIMLFRPVYLGLTVLLGAIWNLLSLRLKGTPDAGIKWAKAFINIVGAFLLWELLIIFFISIFPVWNNLRALPIIALGSILLTLMVSIWDFGGNVFRRLSYIFVIIVVIFEVFSLVLPKTTNAISEKRPGLDKKLAGWIKNPHLPSLKGTSKASTTMTDVVQIPAYTPPEGVYVGIMVEEGQQVTLSQIQSDCTTFSIMGANYCPWKTINQRSYTYPIIAGGGLYLRPEEGRPATIRVTVH